ncbi:hypothetical protein P170DRAFT_262551 [Aspergillus steynii IBT 23096]|uniref:Uncharacterized protein n=1 Tax=Aspergillus steynii IBT 23096 TaxID=1392250 RepID=A0A2I2FZX1_9EURO|nr:uncharacterized protein P170DRAFT_262551 [Aspergillus steynii IBT 23096]PLB46188.1 hypothetical protein P170DRAFT_262551 [Aspergillus steynii IBT 23096]
MHKKLCEVCLARIVEPWTGVNPSISGKLLAPDSYLPCAIIYFLLFCLVESKNTVTVRAPDSPCRRLYCAPRNSFAFTASPI